MSLPIIGLCGNAGSGKNYVASIIGQNFNTIEIAFSDPIKRFLNKGLLVPEEILWGESHLREKALDFIPDNFAYAFESNVGPFVQEVISVSKNNDNPASVEAACLSWFKENKSVFKKKTCRQILQELGTDIFRNINNNTWCDYTLNTVLSILSDRKQYSAKLGLGAISTSSFPDLVVITDVRFANELLGIKRLGGTVCQIVSNDAKIYQHSSETEQLSLPRHWFNFVLVNEKNNIQEFYKRMFNHRVIDMVNKITATKWI